MTSIITLLCTLLITSSVYDNNAIYYGDQSNVYVENGVLKGRIETQKELPNEYYGIWSVSSTLIDTNSPDLFNKTGSDLWKFEKINGIITLSNPTSGASASIRVDNVKGLTAKFTREKNNANVREYESPIITVQGDTFIGEDLLTFELYKKNRLIQKYYVKYKIEGKRLTGPTLKDIYTK